ncbi:conserved hypothetical protein [Agrobacterium tumefaciens str. Kerr 14]|uniref:Uncharacterized protein n=1 Tax=Agrobacterium tumefaciens str. Kerr 14 TaxID=1183424 RepID=A0A1S7SDV6_AGRTU|nr:conserved hypothetical protein [Agrobacterium tumefaciens str. Kerr 14]
MPPYSKTAQKSQTKQCKDGRIFTLRPMARSPVAPSPAASQDLRTKPHIDPWKDASSHPEPWARQSFHVQEFCRLAPFRYHPTPGSSDDPRVWTGRSLSPRNAGPASTRSAPSKPAPDAHSGSPPAALQSGSAVVGPRRSCRRSHGSHQSRHTFNRHIAGNPHHNVRADLQRQDRTNRLRQRRRQNIHKLARLCRNRQRHKCRLGIAALRQARHSRKRQGQNALAHLPAPQGKLVRNNVMTARDINNTNTRLKAFRHDPRLHIIRPTPVSAARLDNFVAAHKSIICHANLQLVLETFSHTQQASKYSQSNGAETALTELLLHRDPQPGTGPQVHLQQSGRRCASSVRSIP